MILAGFDIFRMYGVEWRRRGSNPLALLAVVKSLKRASLHLIT
jgi:hypothetical protein